LNSRELALNPDVEDGHSPAPITFLFPISVDQRFVPLVVLQRFDLPIQPQIQPIFLPPFSCPLSPLQPTASRGSCRRR
jgi:hypothetical protein